MYTIDIPGNWLLGIGLSLVISGLFVISFFSIRKRLRNKAGAKARANEAAALQEKARANEDEKITALQEKDDLGGWWDLYCQFKENTFTMLLPFRCFSISQRIINQGLSSIFLSMG